MILATAALAIVAPITVVNLLLTSALGVAIVSQSWRVSNHLVVCLFVMLLQSIGCGTASNIRLLLGALYLLAAFHKANRDFFDEHSCANTFFDRYITSKLRLASWRRPRLLVPTIVVVLELAAGVLLLNQETAWYGILCALSLHVVLGVSGNPHFSFVAMSLLTLVTAWSGAWQIDLECLLLVPVISALLVLAFQSELFQRRGYSATAARALFAVDAALSIVVVTAARGRHFITDTPASLSAVAVLAIFVANGCRPYFGHLEFSMAMFSNLRPDFQNHAFIRSESARRRFVSGYCELLCAEGLELARDHADPTIRRIAMLFDARCRLLFHTNFVRSALIAFARQDLPLTLRVQRAQRVLELANDQNLDVTLPAIGLLKNSWPPTISRGRADPAIT